MFSEMVKKNVIYLENRSENPLINNMYLNNYFAILTLKNYNNI